MKVIFTSETKEDFRKHNDYVRRLKKSDGHKYQSYELKGINKSFKKNLKDNLEKIKTPKDSIFPKEFEYSSDSHKMYVDKRSHYVVFYTVETTKNGDKIMKVRKNIHSTELKKELEEKDIKPLKNCDQSLLDDLESVYKEDDVKLKDDSEDEKETQEEVTDPDTGRKIKKVKHVGERGGKYYIDDNGNKVYPEEWNESIIDLKTKILESKIVSLVDYLKRMIG
ncbi:MAG: hypothetical protein IKT92_04760 [Bacteroidaceae bacterium]|nr:hypothetical protein [Bacteroidaceae bacterium]